MANNGGFADAIAQFEAIVGNFVSTPSSSTLDLQEQHTKLLLQQCTQGIKLCNDKLANVATPTSIQTSPSETEVSSNLTRLQAIHHTLRHHQRQLQYAIHGQPIWSLPSNAEDGILNPTAFHRQRMIVAWRILWLTEQLTLGTYESTLPPGIPTRYGRFGVHAPNAPLHITASQLPPHQRFLLDPSHPVSLEWSIFITLASQLTETERTLEHRLDSTLATLDLQDRTQPAPAIPADHFRERTAGAAVSTLGNNGTGGGSGISESACPICHESWSAAYTVQQESKAHFAVVQTRCGHYFCGACLEVWIRGSRDVDGEGNAACPMCRALMPGSVGLWPAGVDRCVERAWGLLAGWEEVDRGVDRVLMRMVEEDAGRCHGGGEFGELVMEMERALGEVKKWETEFEAAVQAVPFS